MVKLSKVNAAPITKEVIKMSESLKRSRLHQGRLAEAVWTRLGSIREAAPADLVRRLIDLREM